MGKKKWRDRRKEYMREYMKSWRKRNTAKTTLYQQRWREKYPEKYAAYCKLSNERAKAKRLANRKPRVVMSPEEKRLRKIVRQREYRAKNIEKERARSVACYKKYKAKYIATRYKKADARYVKPRNVYYCESRGDYKVAFGIDWKDVHIGYYETEAEAVNAAKYWRGRLKVKRKGPERAKTIEALLKEIAALQKA